MNPINATQAYAGRTEAAYSRWAPVYDLIFDLPFHPGRAAAARAARMEGRRPTPPVPAARSWLSASAPGSNCRCSPAMCW
jgi:hypothetical protein